MESEHGELRPDVSVNWINGFSKRMPALVPKLLMLRPRPHLQHRDPAQSPESSRTSQFGSQRREEWMSARARPPDGQQTRLKHRNAAKPHGARPR